jgi:hypothetical protein
MLLGRRSTAIAASKLIRGLTLKLAVRHFEGGTTAGTATKRTVAGAGAAFGAKTAEGEGSV